METITFTIEETGEDVKFAVLSSIVRDEVNYSLVVDADEMDCDDMTAYIIKAVEQDNDDIIYEIVDDDEELLLVSDTLMNALEDYEIDM